MIVCLGSHGDVNAFKLDGRHGMLRGSYCDPCNTVYALGSVLGLCLRARCEEPKDRNRSPRRRACCCVPGPQSRMWRDPYLHFTLRYASLPLPYVFGPKFSRHTREHIRHVVIDKEITTPPSIASRLRRPPAALTPIQLPLPYS